MVSAIVVLYRPDLVCLERLLTSLNGQLKEVIAVDNTSTPVEGLSAVLGRHLDFVYYVPLGENKGIAAAQNIGIREGVGRGCSHVLLLDQDSAAGPDMVEKLLAAEGELLKRGRNVAAVGPRYVDEKTGTPSYAFRRGLLLVHKHALDPRSSEPVETDNLIASGSLVRTSALESIGAMREDLFIDFVDTEWGLRARNRGLKSYCVPDAMMTHSTGDAATRIFGKEVYLHSEPRLYYKVRNAMYLLRLPTLGWLWRGYTLRWIPYYIALNIWISQDRLRSLRLLLRALWDGFMGRVGPAPQDLAVKGAGGSKTAVSFEGTR